MRISDTTVLKKTWWVIENIATKPIMLFLISSFILITGCIVALLGCDDYALSRAGAVLVAVTIVGVYLNHHIGNEIRNNTSLRDNTRHITNFETAKRLVANQNPNITEAAILDRYARSILEIRETANQYLPELNLAQVRVVKYEFINGILGTLIWGFGDIPFI